MEEGSPYNSKGFGGEPLVRSKGKASKDKKVKSLFREPLISQEFIDDSVGMIKKGAGIAKQAIIDDTITQPSSRDYQTEYEGGQKRALGTGKSWTNNIDFYTDRTQQGLQFGFGLAGRNASNSVLDGKFWKSGGLVRNVGTGLVLGMAADVAGEVAGHRFDDTSELESDLKAARYHGEDDVQARIMKKINEQKTEGSNARTFGDAVSKGTNGGWWGVLAGATAGAGVNVLRNSMGGEEHQSYDADFMKGIKARRNALVNSAFSKEGSEISPSEALDMVNEQLKSGYEMEKNWDSVVPDIDTLNSIKSYVEKNPEPELVEKFNTLRSYFDNTAKMGITKEVFDSRREFARKHANSKEELKSKYSKK